MPANTVQNIEAVGVVLLVVGYVLICLMRRLVRSRPELRIGAPLAVGFGLRLAAIAGISATGLEATLRGGDEITFLTFARVLAMQPLGRNYWPHGLYQLHTVLFSLEIRLGLTVGAMRIVQVGIALTGVILIVAAVHDLANGRAARFAAWLLAFEPATIFFNSAIHKDPLMELASGLVVFGGTRIWLRLDIRGILICALGGLIAVETRSYAGWFLIAAAVLVLLHAAVRGLDRPMRAMPLIYAVVIAGFIAAPAIIQASSKKNLQALQNSQNSNSTGAGEGPAGGANSHNLALEQVNYSSRGAILKNLPKRIRDVVLRPYPWQLSDNSQRFGAVGTLFAYAVLILLARYAWLSRGRVLPSIAPILYPMLFLLIAYSLSAGNAGTGFRYRTHLVVLSVAAMAILREQAAPVLARRRAERGRKEAVGAAEPFNPAPRAV